MLLSRIRQPDRVTGRHTRRTDLDGRFAAFFQYPDGIISGEGKAQTVGRPNRIIHVALLKIGQRRDTTSIYFQAVNIAVQSLRQVIGKNVIWVFALYKGQSLAIRRPYRCVAAPAIRFAS